MKSYRLNEACHLFRETPLSVAEVAVRVGYQNPGHFSDAFRKKYHMLPGEYKKRIQFEQ
ncbi:MAG: AraC family transcriptional regulator [Lachnospiraceae bacterium]|nr:AraC family transcriptional regulator [Lachnospiraceae bacterium]